MREELKYKDYSSLTKSSELSFVNHAWFLNFIFYELFN